MNEDRLKNKNFRPNSMISPLQASENIRDKMVEDLVAFLDDSIRKGVGHLNVETDETQQEMKKVDTLGCSDCAKGNVACRVPTLHEGIDD